MKIRTLVLALVLGAMVIPATAEASLFKIWFSGRGDYFSGTSDLFTEFDNEIGGALEVGVELMGISLFTEATMLGTDQFLFTIDGGLDFSFGDSVRFTVGAFTGPMLLMFPEEEVESVDFSGLPQDQIDALLVATGTSTLDELEQNFDQFAEQEQELGSLAFGWNLLRGRLALDFSLIPTLYLGVAGQVGYHYIISGEDVAAGAKNQAIENYSTQYDLPVQLTDALRDAVGAHPVDRENLNGVNWDVNLYLRLEFGL